MRRRWMRPRSSTQGARYEPKNGPPIIQTLGQCWGLPEADQRAWWRSLCLATWSTAVAWREWSIALSPNQPGARAAVEHHCLPANLAMTSVTPVCTLADLTDWSKERVGRPSQIL